MNWLKHTFNAAWVAVTGLTLTQFNLILGTVSLILGIIYQVRKDRRDARRSHLEGKD